MSVLNGTYFQLNINDSKVLFAKGGKYISNLSEMNASTKQSGKDYAFQGGRLKARITADGLVSVGESTGGSSNSTALWNKHYNREKITWRLYTARDFSTYYEGSGLITEVGKSGNVEDIVTYSVSIRVDGEPVYVSSDLPSNDPDVQAYIDQITIDGFTPPSGINIDALNTLVTILKSSGIWPLLDCLWIFTQNGDSNAALYNLKNPTSFRGTNINSVTYLGINGGYKGNAINSYIDLSYIPSIDAINLELESTSIFVLTKDDGTAITDSLVGTSNSSGIGRFILLFGRSSDVLARINNGVVNTLTSPKSHGLWCASRNENDDVSLYKDGVNVASVNLEPSPQLADSPLLSHAFPVTGVPRDFSPNAIQIIGIGSSLTDQQNIDLNSAIQTYITAVTP